MSRRLLLAVAALAVGAAPAAQATSATVNCAGLVTSCSWRAAAPTGVFAYAATAGAMSFTIACDGGGGLSVDVATAGADARTFEQAGLCTLTVSVQTGPAAYSVLVAQQSVA